MSSLEVSILVAAHYKAYKERWEMLRLQNHAVLASQSTKSLKPEDIMQFEWDNKGKESKVITKEEADKVRENIRKKFNIQ